MATRSLASLSIAFGLVSIPVKVHAATDASAALHFKLLGRGGARLRQQFVAETDTEDEAATAEPVAPLAQGATTHEAPRGTEPRGRSADLDPSEHSGIPSDGAEPASRAVVERPDIVKGYEFEKGKFVLFTPDELKALAAGSRTTIDIVSFIPERSVDPVYFDKPYFLAPDAGGSRPYALLLHAMRETGRCALAKWAWRSRQHVVQIRPGDGGLVLQQLRYAEEVRAMADLGIELAEVGAAELELAIRLIDQISVDAYDPHQFVDEEKMRIRAAIERKIAGRDVVAPQGRAKSGAEIVDLMQALRASLGANAQARTVRSAASGSGTGKEPAAQRKPAKRAGARAGSAAARSARSGR